MSGAMDRVARGTAAAVVASTLLLGACATVGPPPPDAAGPGIATTQPPDGAGWWNVHFRVAWPAGAAPAWHVDALLAHRVLGPLLEERGGELVLWRFHRRAARDEAGHLFSFIYYAPAAVAAEVAARIGSDELVARLRDEGYLEGVLIDDTTAPLQADLAHTSDPSWPPEVQRSWPWFIMGVSAHWLRLIAEVQARAPPPAGADTASLVAAYAAVEERIAALWRERGQHVYLHHLNALFGYQPIRLQELKRF